MENERMFKCSECGKIIPYSKVIFSEECIAECCGLPYYQVEASSSCCRASVVEVEWVRYGNRHHVENFGKPNRVDKMYYYYRCYACGMEIEVEEGAELPKCKCYENMEV